MNEETAGPYVAAYEEVYRHNVIVREETETIREIVVGAGVVSVRGRDDGYVVVVRVGFYWTFGNDGSGRPTGIADGRPYEATYFVNGTRTDRLNDTLAVEERLAAAEGDQPSESYSSDESLRSARSVDSVRFPRCRRDCTAQAS